MRFKKSSCALIAALAAAAGAKSASAAVIADWTFESLASTYSHAPGAGVAETNYNADTGTGQATGLHTGAATYSSPAGNGSARSFSANVWASGDYWQFKTATTGVTGIALAWDQTGSGTGPNKYQLEYSTDGSSFTNSGSAYTLQVNGAPNTAWSVAAGVQTLYHYSADLSSVPALDNQANVYFRLVDVATTNFTGGAIGTGGTDRVDNFAVEQPSDLPEPASLAFLGGIGLLPLRRRRR